MNQISPEAAARRDTHRQHGKFGIQPADESGTIPTGVPQLSFGDAKRDLEEWMDSDDPFAIRILVGHQADSLVTELEKARSSQVYSNPYTLGPDTTVSSSDGGPTVAAYRFPEATAEAFAARADEVALSMRATPHALAAMGMHTHSQPVGRTRVLLVCPDMVRMSARPAETPTEEFVRNVRPEDDDSVNDLLNSATVVVVTD